jgi:hypothetical protein
MLTEMIQTHRLTAVLLSPPSAQPWPPLRPLFSTPAGSLRDCRRWVGPMLRRARKYGLQVRRGLQPLSWIVTDPDHGLGELWQILPTDPV